MSLSRYGVLVVLIAGLLLPSSVLAEARQYISLMGGYTAVLDADAGFLEDAEFDDGFVAGVAVGYDFDTGNEYGYGDARLEVEFSYRKNDFDQVKFQGAEIAADGEVNSQSLMANAYYLVENPSIVKPFFLFGIGAARIDIDEASIAGVNFIDEDEYNLAYQAGAGLAFELTESLELDLGYRYFRIANTDFEDAVDNEFSFGYETHNAYLGLLYAF
jgi:opacity protein-like surface antigen